MSITENVQRGNVSDLSPRKAKNKLKSVFEAALPLQKHPEPNEVRPRAISASIPIRFNPY